jgi:hypothetical protein
MVAVTTIDSLVSGAELVAATPHKPHCGNVVIKFTRPEPRVTLRLG